MLQRPEGVIHGNAKTARPFPRSPRNDGAPPVGAGTSPRLCARAAHQAGVERPAAGRGRIPLPCAAAPSQGQTGQRRVGCVGDQPQGAHLSNHDRRPQASGRGNLQLRANARGHQPRTRRGRRMMNPFTWFRRSRLNDVSDEIRSHIEEKTDEFVASGMSRADAELAARRAFGNVVKLQEAARDVWRFESFMDNLAADVRLAFRGLMRKPGYAIAVALTLAL